MLELLVVFAEVFESNFGCTTKHGRSFIEGEVGRALVIGGDWKDIGKKGSSGELLRFRPKKGTSSCSLMPINLFLPLYLCLSYPMLFTGLETGGNLWHGAHVHIYFFSLFREINHGTSIYGLLLVCLQINKYCIDLNYTISSVMSLWLKTKFNHYSGTWWTKPEILHLIHISVSRLVKSQP